jgi:hypothetical protein
MDDQTPARPELGFRSLDDFRLASKRVDLMFFCSNASAQVMGGVIRRFLQDDGIVVIDAVSKVISRSELARDLPALGCEFGRVMTLRRLPGAFAVGCDVAADFMTRVSGKLVGEFFGVLGRVVVGAEVIVDCWFKRPEGLLGPYIIVAVAGAEIGQSAAEGDRDLVAVDLSASSIGCCLVLRSTDAANLRRLPSHRNWSGSVIGVSAPAERYT